jgi:GntR family transcriptional regulator, histidine utilization repressor
MPRTAQPVAAATPRYRQVKEAITARIARGDLAPGDRIMSENEIVAQFGVSRMTANRAVRELMFEGVLTRIAGVGTFVARPMIDADLLQVRNIADEVAGRGHAYCGRLIDARAVAGPEGITDLLGLPAGSSVFRTVIVHHEDGLPIQLEDRYVNPQVAPDYLSVDFNTVTPNAYLSAVAPITAFEHFVEAVRPDAQARALLGIDAQEPCLRLFRRTWSAGRTVTCAWLTHAGSRYRMEARVGPTDGCARPPPAGDTP